MDTRSVLKKSKEMAIEAKELMHNSLMDNREMSDELRSIISKKVYDSAVFHSPTVVLTMHRIIEELTAACRFYAQKRLYTNVGIQSDLYDDKGRLAEQALKVLGETKLKIVKKEEI